MTPPRAAGALLPLALAAAALGGCGESTARPAEAPVEPAPRATATTPAAPAVAVAPLPDGARDVVLVTIDTLRADAVGFAGAPGVETPWLDRLAAGGRVYSRAYAHNVVTLPSHANLLTGLYPPGHGVRENSGFVLAAGVPTLATRLREAGWATGAFVGAFPLDRRFGLARGFDVYDDRYGAGPDAEFRFAERRGDEVVAAALAWWRGAAGKPRFLWVHLYDPHAPYAPPSPFAARYRDRPYHGEVAATDAFLGPLLAPFLEGRETPALVAVTADHGEALGEHGEATHGLFVYEATLRVPLVLWGPGIPAGRDARLAGHVDLVPTILARLGLAVPADLPGRSLLAAEEPGRPLYFEALSTYFNRGWAPLRGVVAGGWKAIALPLPELYDVARDPAEGDNRVDAERRRYREALAALPDETWPPAAERRVTSEEARRLRSLGYVTSSGPRRDRFGADDDPKSLVELDRLLHASIAAYQAGDLAEAERLARRLVEARPEMAMGWSHLASVLRQAERRGEALAVLETAARSGATSDSLLRQLGLALAEAGRAADAVAVLAPLATRDDVETLEAYGVALSDAGRQAEAETALRRALVLDPTAAKALETLGAVHLRQGRPADAVGVLERAVELGPSLPIAWNSLGVARAMVGRERAALDAWRRAVELDGRQLDALYNLGMTAARVGETAAARSALERYVAVAPAERHAADVEKARAVLRSLGT